MNRITSAFNKIHRKFGEDRRVVFFTTDLTEQNCFGMACPNGDGSWAILLEENLPFAAQLHFLIHEYAHTLVPGYEKYQHGPAWGVIHAAIYSFVFDGVSVTRKRRKRKIRVGGA